MTELARRGTTNGNARGSNETRRRRREWLVATYRAEVDLAAKTGQAGFRWDRGAKQAVDLGTGVPACRCYRCGILLSSRTVSVDRIVPGAHGGTYRRENIRPCCLDCNSETGGRVRSKP